jgi:nicotinamide mononucleotide transporter
MLALEILAVGLAFAYLLLVIRQNIYCWLAAALSAALYLWLMYSAGLYMESALQVFYIAMAGYGWSQWRGGRFDNELQVSDWPAAFHLLPIVLIVALTVLTGRLLADWTDAAAPYIDSFTTWGALWATWMVARKIIQNWHYWFVIDSVSVYLFSTRELWWTAGLFVVYLVLILVGYRAWRRELHVQLNAHSINE